jgi:hypothetical protein
MSDEFRRWVRRVEVEREPHAQRDARAQSPDCSYAIVFERTGFLRLARSAGLSMAEAHGGFDFVAALAAGTAGTVTLFAALLQQGNITEVKPGVP